VLALGYGRAVQLAEEDRPLLDALAALHEDALLSVTAWACRSACRRADLEDLDWVAPSLAALERGAPLPPPFDDHGTAWDRLFAYWDDGTRTVLETSAEVTADPGRTPLAPEAAALDAVLSAAAQDPLQAAVDAVVGAASSFVLPQEWYDQVRHHLAERTAQGAG
jgi:hypothetical protein